MTNSRPLTAHSSRGTAWICVEIRRDLHRRPTKENIKHMAWPQPIRFSQFFSRPIY